MRMTPVTGQFRFHVAPTSGVPIYRQFMDQVRARIATGRLGPGQFLPSIRDVAAQLAVNPMTVSKAYSLLERDGLLELVRGQGMRVNPSHHAANSARPNLVRQAQIQRLLEKLVALARDAGLTSEELRALLSSTLEEFEHATNRPRTR